MHTSCSGQSAAAAGGAVTGRMRLLGQVSSNAAQAVLHTVAVGEACGGPGAWHCTAACVGSAGRCHSLLASAGKLRRGCSGVAVRRSPAEAASQTAWQVQLLHSFKRTIS